MSHSAGLFLVTFAAIFAGFYSVTAFDCSFESIYPNTYVAYKSADPPSSLDGNLNKPFWSEVPWTAHFQDISTSVTPRFFTHAKVRWTDEHLYFGAYMQEPQVWATLKQHDSIIFHDNDIEFFVDPSATTHMYKEAEANCFGTTWFLCLNKPYLNGGYENSSRVFGSHGFDEPNTTDAVQVLGCPINDPSVNCTGWSIEVRFDLATLAFNTSVAVPPNHNDTWRMQLSRVEWHVDVVNGTYEKVPNVAEDNWVWQPMGVIDVHLPERWGFLVFSTDPVNTTTPVRQADWTVRSVAMQLYYAQAVYHRLHGEFAASVTSDLAQMAPLGAPAIDGTCTVGTPSITVDSSRQHFNATVSDGHFQAFIRDDRYITTAAVHAAFQ